MMGIALLIGVAILVVIAINVVLQETGVTDHIGDELRQCRDDEE